MFCAGDLFADVPLEAMPAPKHSASPRSGGATAASRPAEARQQSNPFSEYSVAVGGGSIAGAKSARSGGAGLTPAAPNSAALNAAAGGAASKAATPGGGGKAGSVALLQISASAAAAGSTASRCVALRKLPPLALPQSIGAWISAQIR